VHLGCVVHGRKPPILLLLRMRMVMCSLNQCVSVYFFFCPELTPNLTTPYCNTQGIFQLKIISAILGSYINSITPLHINVKTDRPVGALILAIQSEHICHIFCVAATCVSCCRQSMQSASTQLELCASHHVMWPISPRLTGGTISSMMLIDLRFLSTQRPPLSTSSTN
jgi:hypothetical protein